MLIDDITIRIKAGKGGRGAVSFNKNMMSLGPTGGRGGNGGSVYFLGVSDASALNAFRYEKEKAAADGEFGKPQFNDGTAAEDLTLKVPVGTVVHNLDFPDGSKDLEIVKIGERVRIAKGGLGGKGNFRFRSPTNTTPRDFQEGLPGESYTVRLELKLIADVGFVGLPNVGKSSLLNELTAASAKVANYPFTTLEPNLGVYYDLILADIPGLIEGASEGKGLGHKFLRHVERTKILFHFISAESDDPKRDYDIIRGELGAHNKTLLKKKEHLFLTKIDVLKPGELEKKMKVLKRIHRSASPLSIYDLDSMNALKKILNKIMADKTV